VLCAYGVTPEGKYEMIGLHQPVAESEAQWETFLRNLYEQGLERNNPQFVVTDGPCLNET
jgi:transposase-like protein